MSTYPRPLSELGSFLTGESPLHAFDRDEMIVFGPDPAGHYWSVRQVTDGQERAPIFEWPATPRRGIALQRMDWIDIVDAEVVPREPRR